MKQIVVLAITAILLTGCAARQRQARTWKLEPAERGHVLIPPRADPVKAEFVLKSARSAGNFSGPACTLRQEEITLQWHGLDARVRADAGALAPLPGSLASATTPGGSAMPLGNQTVVTANWFEEVLRPALREQVAAGCLTTKDLALLDRRLIDNLALPSSALYRLRIGEFTLNGYVDLNAEFRLRTVEPIRERGVVTGFLTSFYLLSAAPDGGVVASAGESEINIQGKLTAGKAGDSEILHLPAGATWLRLFFRTWSRTEDRRIALIAAPTKDERERASKEFESGPESYCGGAAKARNVACVSVPKDMVLGPELRVTVNGRDAFVAVSGVLGEVLRSSGVRDTSEALKTLQVKRPYEGKLTPVEFDRTRTEILSLVLIGGEQITW